MTSNGKWQRVKNRKGEKPILSTFENLSKDRQESIFDAAASVFAEEGYHYARISKICEKAGISNGALYKYFKNKEDLFYGVLDYGVKLVVNELYAKHTTKSLSIFDSIKNFLTELVEFTENYRDYISIYSDLGSSSMKRFAYLGSEKFEKEASVYTTKMVRASMERREINSKISVDMAAYMIDSYITFFVYSQVSEYHVKRFDSFYSVEEKTLSNDERITLIVKSLRIILAGD
ncbi:UNVERIFIED_CONTAM: TetR family transcriptional regulator [Acetivibrio alkalicellulosi]